MHIRLLLAGSAATVLVIFAPQLTLLAAHGPPFICASVSLHSLLLQTEVKGLKRSLETAKGDGGLRMGPASVGRARTNFKPMLRGGEEASAEDVASFANPLAGGGAGAGGGNAANASTALAGFANKGIKLSAVAKRRNRASIVESKAGGASSSGADDADAATGVAADPDSAPSPRAAAAAAAASSSSDA